MVQTCFYLIQNHTHLHAGSGDSNYGVIDKLVQRDPGDGLPCLFASSLKGAFREYFEEVIERDKDKGQKDLTNSVFGKRGTDEKGSAKGSHIFHDALLLSIPLRSNCKPYYSATAPMVLNKLLYFSELFNYQLPAALLNEIKVLTASGYTQKGQAFVYQQVPQNLKIEDYHGNNIIGKNESVSNLSAILGTNMVLLHDDDFKDQCNDYNLPVIARNSLENGESTNLWYEQIIPRESRFFTVVNYYNLHGDADAFYAKMNNQRVQIGANASVGYGICRISDENLTTKTA